MCLSSLSPSRPFGFYRCSALPPLLDAWGYFSVGALCSSCIAFFPATYLSFPYSGGLDVEICSSRFLFANVYTSRLSVFFQTGSHAVLFPFFVVFPSSHTLTPKEDMFLREVSVCSYMICSC